MTIWKLTKEELPKKSGIYLIVTLWDGTLEKIFYTGIKELEEIRMTNYKLWTYLEDYENSLRL